MEIERAGLLTEAGSVALDLALLRRDVTVDPVARHYRDELVARFPVDGERHVALLAVELPAVKRSVADRVSRIDDSETKVYRSRE